MLESAARCPQNGSIHGELVCFVAVDLRIPDGQRPESVRPLVIDVAFPRRLCSGQGRHTGRGGGGGVPLGLCFGRTAWRVDGGFLQVAGEVSCMQGCRDGHRFRSPQGRRRAVGAHRRGARTPTGRPRGGGTALRAAPGGRLVPAGVGRERQPEVHARSRVLHHRDGIVCRRPWGLQLLRATPNLRRLLSKWPLPCAHHQAHLHLGLRRVVSEGRCQCKRWGPQGVARRLRAVSLARCCEL
mmetsp:Transcript_96058/g.311636  ORF Transcript_96058/g.311636 Transcript_96058/m.311636 type:complete len:241 (-) Transcript_96058:1178-1900(-)